MAINLNVKNIANYLKHGPLDAVRELDAEFRRRARVLRVEADGGKPVEDKGSENYTFSKVGLLNWLDSLQRVGRPRRTTAEENARRKAEHEILRTLIATTTARIGKPRGK